MAKNKRRKTLDIAKRKKSRDYTDKITKESTRFSEDIIEKKSKLNNSKKDETIATDRSFSSKKRKNRHLNSKKSKLDKETNTDKTINQSEETSVLTEESAELKGGDKTFLESQNADIKKKDGLKKQKQIEKIKKQNQSISEEVYAPLSKDMDNDGIIDRYDNDFRDSDYEESTYDIDSLSKNEKQKNIKFTKHTQKGNSRQNNQKKVEKLTTDDVKATNKLKEGEEVKEAAFNLGNLDENARNKFLKKESKLNKKKKKISKLYNKPKYSKSSKLLGSLSGASFIAAEYMGVGSEENVGVESTQKGLFLGSSLSKEAQNKLQRKRRNPLKDEKKFALKHKKNMAKAEYSSNLRQLKKDKSYQGKSAYKKLVKRRQMKKKIYKEHKIAITFKDKLKKFANDIIKGGAKIIIRRFGGILLGIGAIAIILVLISQVATMLVGGMSAITSDVMGTTYLSSEDTLSNMNQEFSSFEYKLEDELANIETNHPGYDEYILNKNCDIGHDTHVLLSYITAKYGEVNDVNDISAELANLFNEMYEVKYETKVEVRYREVCTGSGENRECHDEPYNWYKLVTTVNKKDMDSMARANFNGYDDNLAHYETLLESKGNMELVFGSGNGDLSEIIDNPDFKNPGIAFTDYEAKKLFNEAEKHIGKRYVFGANGPANFDCSSFVCWSFSHSGIKNMPRTTAYQIYKTYCNPVRPSEAKAGDIIFFTGTYNSGTPISHVGIYAGNGMMLHAGDPIRYTNINTNYWKQHFYCFGRVK